MKKFQPCFYSFVYDNSDKYGATTAMKMKTIIK